MRSKISSVKPLALSVAWLMCGQPSSVPLPRQVANDVVDVALGVAQPREGGRHRSVDDLEIAAAGQLLELDQGEVRLDAGRVAIHHQGDGAGGGDASYLGVAKAVLFAQAEHVIAFVAGRGQEIVGAIAFIEPDRSDAQAFVIRGRGVVAARR